MQNHAVLSQPQAIAEFILRVFTTPRNFDFAAQFGY
jgi:hypothetical protein